MIVYSKKNISTVRKLKSKINIFNLFPVTPYKIETGQVRITRNFFRILVQLNNRAPTICKIYSAM